MYTVKQIIELDAFIRERAFEISKFLQKADPELKFCINGYGSEEWNITADGLVELTDTLYGSRGYYERWEKIIPLPTFLDDNWKSILTHEIEMDAAALREVNRITEEHIKREELLKEFELFKTLKQKFEGE